MSDGRRVPVAAEPLLDGRHDYADSFEVRLAQPDTHSAEDWARTAFEQAPPMLRGLIRFVHARIARFQLSAGRDGILGWGTVRSEPDVMHLQTDGPLLRADIVARRTSPTTSTATTFLCYRRPLAAVLWKVIGPLHRRVAPYLLGRAAAVLTGERRAPAA
jgi:hypothetical protein